MIISKSKRFVKSYKRKDNFIKNSFDERLMIFVKNPTLRELNNHSLEGIYDGYRSINITGDYRAVFKEYPKGTYEFVDFIDIGTHSQLYR